MRSVRRALPLGILLLVLAVMWEAGTSFLNIPHYILPKLSDVLYSTWDNRAVLVKHLGATLGEALLGLAFSVIFGVVAAIGIEASGLAKQTLYPLLIASQSVPIIALSPIMVMWFGYDIWSKVAVVILFSFFPLAVNTADGFRSADPGIGELLRTMGAGKRQLFLKWKLPSALPGFFTGLKLAATFSIGGATLGEWLGGETGLGVYTKRASNMLRGEAVFSGVLLLSLTGVLMFAAAGLLGRMVLAKRGQQR
ncbi:ABC transporter permease [Paenibacillus pinistramenti]|uniref:ABC transporter permease n=1 Tax=Paenibacillus pinistramenti TaxID=1768003 RepID=UPI00110822E5|nr:ABC transporter permease [Paenibacillus pinistramenti]